MNRIEIQTTTHDDTVAALRDYEDRYRRDDVARLEVSGLYGLGPSAVHATAGYWPEQYPHSDRSGVYVILDADRQVLYIGTAKVIGNRLSNYFRGNGVCVLNPNDVWPRPPVYVMTVAVPVDMTWEGKGLEDYLINGLLPCCNYEGRVARGEVIRRVRRDKNIPEGQGDEN